MKTIVIMLVGIFANTAFASHNVDDKIVNFVEFNEDIRAISNIGGYAKTQIDTIYPNCPYPRQCLPMTQITVDIEFALHGCVDQLGTFTYKNVYNSATRTETIFVSATNLHHEMSRRTMCIRMPTEFKKITFFSTPGVKNVDVVFLGVEDQLPIFP